MRIFLFTLSFLVLGISVTGQESQAISAADFSNMVYQGTRAIARPYRYTAKPSGDVGVKREVDAKGSIRTTVLNHRTGVVDSECVVIGNQIYERRGTGGWTVETRPEKGAANTASSTGTQNPLSSYSRATFEALFTPTPDVLVEPSNANPLNKTVTFAGTQTHRDKVLRFYRLKGSTSKFTEPTDDLRELRIEIVYGFDEKTGALLVARSRHDWVYESKTKTFTALYEWEQDPSIVITAPVVSDLKN